MKIIEFLKSFVSFHYIFLQMITCLTVSCDFLSASVLRTAREYFCPTNCRYIVAELLLGPLVIELVWYILKQLFTSVSVKVVDIYLHFSE